MQLSVAGGYHLKPIARDSEYARCNVKVTIKLINLLFSLAIVSDYFVVELTMLESPCRQVYTISERDCNGERYDR